MKAIAAVLEVLLGLSVAFHLLPWTAGQVFPRSWVLFPTSWGGYGVRDLVGLMLITVVILALRRWLHRESPRRMFEPANLSGQLRLGLTAAAFMLIWQAAGSLNPAIMVGQARALALTAVYQATGSIYGPWLAHAVNNAVGSLSLAVAVYAPNLAMALGGLLVLLSLAWILTHRADTRLLWGHVKEVFTTLHRGALPGLGLLLLLVGGVWLHWRLQPGGPALLGAHLFGLTGLLLLTRRMVRRRSGEAERAARVGV